MDGPSWPYQVSLATHQLEQPLSFLHSSSILPSFISSVNGPGQASWLPTVDQLPANMPPDAGQTLQPSYIAASLSELWGTEALLSPTLVPPLDAVEMHNPMPQNLVYPSLPLQSHQSTIQSQHLRSPHSKPKRTRKSLSRSSSRNPISNFINLTPDDSATIINGVAPSGSFKTIKKRKKAATKEMDELVRKLVHIAGGDSSLLEGELGLTVGPHYMVVKKPSNTLRSDGPD